MSDERSIFTVRVTPEQIRANREAWVKALRSGDYRQGMNSLKQDDAFCCLGVACDISGMGEWTLDNRYRTPDYSSPIYMPRDVAIVFGCSADEQSLLSRRNDRGYNFFFIADLIERAT